MASGMASAVAVSCVGAMIGRSSFVAWSGTVGKIRLNSTASSDGASGTEISGGSYVAGGVTLGTISTTFGVAGYSAGVASVTNSGAAVTQTNMPAATTVAADLIDNGGTRWWWGDLSANVTTNLGDTLTFNTSSITVQLNV